MVVEVGDEWFYYLFSQHKVYTITLNNAYTIAKVSCLYIKETTWEFFKSLYFFFVSSQTTANICI